MSYSYTVTDTDTFTRTHAVHIAAKVATDLKRMQRFYGEPSDGWIAAYELEVVELLRAGFLGTVTYGYQRSGSWIEPTLFYTARVLAGSPARDDDPGRVRPGAPIADASFFSYLTYSPAWHTLTDREREEFKSRLQFHRRGASEPGLSGYVSVDRTYSSGGRALERASLRSYR